MKKIQHLIVLMAVLTIAWGCSSDGDDTNPPSHPRYTVMEAPTAPSWDYIKDINWMSDEPLPDWAAPDPLQFESTMVLQVKLDEDLFSYASDKDLMSVTKGEECRALSLCNFKEVQGTGESVAYFILAIKGNNDERDALLSVNYYCENLKQTFVMKDIMPFVPDLVYGIYDDSENFQPYFSMGSTKYPVKPIVSISLSGDLPFTMQAGDKLALFVGDELRGSTEINQNTTLDNIVCVLFSKQAGEEVNVRYYSQQQAKIYQLNQTFLSADEVADVRLEF